MNPTISDELRELASYMGNKYLSGIFGNQISRRFEENNRKVA